jgi:hypothetical protein
MMSLDALQQCCTCQIEILARYPKRPLNKQVTTRCICAIAKCWRLRSPPRLDPSSSVRPGCFRARRCPLRRTPPHASWQERLDDGRRRDHRVFTWTKTRSMSSSSRSCQHSSGRAFPCLHRGIVRWRSACSVYNNFPTASSRCVTRCSGRGSEPAIRS